MARLKRRRRPVQPTRATSYGRSTNDARHSRSGTRPDQDDSARCHRSGRGGIIRALLRPSNIEPASCKITLASSPLTANWTACGIAAPCVDAPTNASEILFGHGHVVERCRVSGLKMRLSHAPDPYGSARIGSITLTRARGASVRTGFPDPVLSTVCP
ncbi:hypothetical protein GGD83_005011 [Rhodoblastus sphagnicola]|nr:hypothetical protein [Rhodoblastus sphagnicola]